MLWFKKKDQCFFNTNSLYFIIYKYYLKLNYMYTKKEWTKMLSIKMIKIKCANLGRCIVFTFFSIHLHESSLVCAFYTAFLQNEDSYS